MIKILKQCQSLNKLIAVYTNKSDYDRFAVGYIAGITEAEILLYCISPNGGYDGYFVCCIDDIFRLEYDTQYLEKIGLLISDKDVKLPKIDFSDNIFMRLLDLAKKEEYIVSVNIDESSDNIIGYVKESDEEYVCIRQVSQYGDADGETILRTDEIIDFCADDIECRTLSRLCKNKV